MNDISREEAERSFREVESLLDTTLEQMSLKLPKCRYVDFSNRSGFEKSGHPYYHWEVAIQQDDNSHGPTSRKEIRVSYSQPITTNLNRSIRLLGMAERFNIGQEPFFKQTFSHEISVDCTVEEICRAIHESFKEATEALESEQSL